MMSSDSSPIKAGVFKCHHNGCQRVFERRHLKQFRRHVETHDPATRRFACPFPGCFHSTRQNSNLKTHIKKHTNEKDLICPNPHCTYATGDPAMLIRHRKRIHGYQPRKFAKHMRYADPEAEYASPPPPRAKPEVNKWHTYPFETSFNSVQAPPLYPAAEALPALSYPALDLESLYPMDSGYDWNAPAMTTESPAPYPNGWSSWESSTASMNWLMPNLPTFVPSSTSTALPSVSYATQSFEERVFYDKFGNEVYPSLASGFPSSTNSYYPTPSSDVNESSNFSYLNDF